MNLFGFITVYGLILSTFPYYLYRTVPLSVFLTYFANVDIICNILAINYPSVFKKLYNPETNTFVEYLSFNTISLVALSGIFIHGIHHTKKKIPDHIVLLSMITMAVVTFKLPTDGIPYITNQILERDHSLKEYEIEITTLISVLFLTIEWLIIHYFILG